MSTNGSLFISSGGTATNIIENGGYVQVDSGGFATFIPNVNKVHRCMIK
jgi:autotransporter passenger strand-loop-strand repeat protein